MFAYIGIYFKIKLSTHIVVKMVSLMIMIAYYDADRCKL